MGAEQTHVWFEIMDSFSTTAVLIVTLVIVSVAFVTKAAMFLHAFIRKSEILNKFPHDPYHWFWGNISEYRKMSDDEKFEYRRLRTGRFPDMCLVWIGPLLPIITLSSAKTLKPILKRSDPKGRMYRFLQPWLGDGLLLSSGDKWARNRRLLTSAFHFDILKPYLEIKNKAADIFCAKIRKFAETGDVFEECSIVTMFTLDVILKCAFSYNTNCQEIGSSHPYVNAVHELGRIISTRIENPFLHVDWIFYLTQNGTAFKKHCNFVHSVTEDIISKRRKALETRREVEPTFKNKKCKDFLDILLMARDETDTGLSDKEIRNEVDTFLFAGHDTTASAIYWTLYSIAQHGEIQDKVQKEIDTLMTGRQTDDILASDLNQLPYLTMCIKESLRIHCVVALIQRQTSHEICGQLIPKDTTTNMSIFSLHHNVTVWEDSMKFNPERFSPENIDKISSFTYIPFSAGPRNCIGQNFAMHEIKVLLVKVLFKFFLEVDLDHTVIKQEGTVMRARDGIKLKAKIRQAGEYRFNNETPL